MKRQEMTAQLKLRDEWDICVIGGGATGLGVAVDAASRGFSTILFERFDFAKGTSSRSTKLVHGGVRYLQQGNIRLVMDALSERGLMMKNAPHLVKNQSFVIPNYEWWESPFYGFGLKAYDWMAGNLGLGSTEFLSLEETLAAVPTLDPTGLRGGIRYHDGQFDDTRMAIHLAMTAADHGAVILNYFNVAEFIKDSDDISGVVVTDSLTDIQYRIKAKAVINATGVFSDTILQMDDPDAASVISPSQGIHLVLDKEFLPEDTAIMIPRTDDGRVLFAVPWHHKIIVGTTDTPVEHPDIEPLAREEEIDFVLQHIRDYLTKEPMYEDIRSVFCGLRPLMKGAGKTAALSRDHQITVSESGLISITGGKWTTYRRMAEDTVNVAIQRADLSMTPSVTAALPIHGYLEGTDFESALYYYGTDKEYVLAMVSEDPSLGEQIHDHFPYIKAEIYWAVKEEMCVAIEDFLARRSRMLFLDAKASVEAAPLVAQIMAVLLNEDEVWIRQQVDAYNQLAKNYLPTGKSNNA
ncbi:MAG TPA: glycerol-3-phosphate dehydrogenase/oxidase [Saprospiraceae bacterium]|nr:glycerol-3-phosphate dehydrogenase/oxidase [Saprospiraceae bacterium]